MSDQTDRSRIETFNLFGESGEMPDVVHCETIETRSRVHNWEFKPHRHARLHQVLILSAGGGRAVLDGVPFDLAPGALVNVPVGCVHAFKFWKNTTGWVVTLSAELLDETLHAKEGLRPVLSRPAVLSRGPGAIRDALSDSVRRVFDEYAGRGFARAQILRGLSALLLGLVARHLQDLDQSYIARADNPLLIRFERILEENYLNHWPITKYARALSVSSTHLSRVIRQATGQPASRLIEARLLREARRQLYFTNLNVSEIAFLLGFRDPAYFSRVFAKATGMPPKVFRLRSERAPEAGRRSGAALRDAPPAMDRRARLH